MTQALAPRVNSHVLRLNRFLPFTAAHDQIYEEYQTGEDSLDLSTVALSYAERALGAGARCIVLTGDAGHGKTHMARRLLEEYLGYEADEARRLLLEKCDGGAGIPPAPQRADRADRTTLRVHKDFSEVEPLHAARVLEESLGRHDEALVVCANEGRLRAIVNSSGAGGVCEQIATLFQRSFVSGRASEDGVIHIVNLNYQSVAAINVGGTVSLLRRTLQSWVLDGRRWADRGCGSCSLAPRCSIRRNRTLLAEESEASERRIEKLERLCATVERLGHVITIREMLMLVSYLITGGLTCDAVRQRESGPAGWQHAYSFYNLLFRRPRDLPEDRLYKGIPILLIFRKLDPGVIARRSVDERLLNKGEVFEEGQLDLAVSVTMGGRTRNIDAALGIDGVIGNPQSRAELATEGEAIGAVVAGLRRRAFFDDNESGETGTMMARLGFESGDRFLRMLDGVPPAHERVKLKGMVVAGLHVIQGLRMSSTETTLYLVDPAFGRASAEAAIIARRIPTSSIQLLPMRNAWAGAADELWGLPASVDWIDRGIVLRIEERGVPSKDLALDLHSFECIARSASGYVSEDFYAHEIRRIRTFLGRLAGGERTDEGQISLFMNGKVQSVSIDMGVIQVGGGGVS